MPAESETVFDEPVDSKEVVRLAHRRLRRRAVTTLVGGLVVSALLGLGGEGVRRAVHDPTTTTLPPVVIGAPTLTGGATGPRTARLSWTEPDGGPVRYVLYRDGATIRTVIERRFDDAGLVPGRSYSYAVEAVGADGTRSPKSTGVTVTMPRIDPPSNLEASVRPGLVALDWEPSSDDGVAAYLVFRDGKQLDRVKADTTTYADRTVEQVRTYRYDVRAVDGAGHRSLPASVSVTTPDAEVPSVPTGLTARRDRNTKKETIVVLTWTAATDNVGVAGYRVLRDGKEIGTTSGRTTFTDPAPLDVYEHEYTVQALDAAGNRSKESEPARVPVPVVD